MWVFFVFVFVFVLFFQNKSYSKLDLNKTLHFVSQAVLVHTAETTRVRFFMDLLMDRGHPVMLVSNAGLGKSVLVSNKLSELSEDYAVSNVPFNYYTTSEMLQSEYFVFI